MSLVATNVAELSIGKCRLSVPSRDLRWPRVTVCVASFVPSLSSFSKFVGLREVCDLVECCSRDLQISRITLGSH